MLAGAVVAQTAMDMLRVESLRISPWALREGLILRRLDRLNTGNGGPVDPRNLVTQ